MPAPNLFLTYVSDAERSTAFYSDLFDIEPNFTSPRYVAFEVTPGVLFAIWTGRNGDTTRDTPRTSEIGLMVPGRPRRSMTPTERGSRRAYTSSRNRTTTCSAAPS